MRKVLEGIGYASVLIVCAYLIIVFLPEVDLRLEELSRQAKMAGPYFVTYMRVFGISVGAIFGVAAVYKLYKLIHG